MSDGSTSVLTAATTCATAGIIVGVVTLTGLGLKFSSIVIDYAGGNLLLTAIYTALIVWIVGLAVPVTASYIICAVIAAPAMIKLGVPDFAAHMFIFYYSVLSEVSPPTALSPFAAAAITGGDPYRTTLQAWKYTLPAFLVPFVFVLDPQGIGLLLKLPKDGSWIDIVLITGKTALGLAALAAAAQGWALRRTTTAERLLLVLAGLFLVFPSLLEALMEVMIGRDISYTATFGLAIAIAVLLKQRMQPEGPRRTSDNRAKLGRNEPHETQSICDLRARSECGADRRRRACPAGAQHRHRDRRHRRRLLSARRRHGERAVQARARHAGDARASPAARWTISN